MEAYRSYSDSRSPYADGAPPEYEYAEGHNWYGERFREPERYDDRQVPQQEWHDERSRRGYQQYEHPQYEHPQYDGPHREYPHHEYPPHDYPHPRADEPPRAPASGGRAAPPPAEEPQSQRRAAAGPGAVPSAATAPAAAAPGAAPAGPPGSPGSAVTSGPGGASGAGSGDSVYRSRRPGAAVLLGLPAAVLEIPALLLLADAAFADPVSAGGVVSASCLMLALPLLAFGLYTVATGAVRAAGPNSVQAWLRPPVAYLSVGLVLLLAAGLAA